MPTEAKLYLAVDQGGHASRALVFDARGEMVAKHLCEIATESPRPGWVEHDAEALAASVQSAISGAVEALGAKKDRLVAAGLATQRSSMVCWDRITGQPLSKVISWRDVRAADAMKVFEAEADAIHRKTGLYPSPHYGASKLRWCLDHLPEVQAALREGRLCFGPLASFLTARITGAKATLVLESSRLGLGFMAFLSSLVFLPLSLRPNPPLEQLVDPPVLVQPTRRLPEPVRLDGKQRRLEPGLLELDQPLDQPDGVLE